MADRSPAEIRAYPGSWCLQLTVNLRSREELGVRCLSRADRGNPLSVHDLCTPCVTKKKGVTDQAVRIGAVLLHAGEARGQEEAAVPQSTKKAAFFVRFSCTGAFAWVFTYINTVVKCNNPVDHLSLNFYSTNLLDFFCILLRGLRKRRTAHFPAPEK